MLRRVKQPVTSGTHHETCKPYPFSGFKQINCGLDQRQINVKIHSLLISTQVPNPLGQLTKVLVMR
jgi:hypothetical protein